MSKNPTPRADALRKMREDNFDAGQRKNMANKLAEVAALKAATAEVIAKPRKPKKAKKK